MTAVTVLCVIGSYAVSNSIFDVLVMIASGVVGYAMHRVGMPVAPVVFGLILGPLLEENIRRTLIVNDTWSVFVTRPISADAAADIDRRAGLPPVPGPEGEEEGIS